MTILGEKPLILLSFSVVLKDSENRSEERLREGWVTKIGEDWRKSGERLTTFRGSGPSSRPLFARIKLKLKEEKRSLVI